MDDSVIEPDLGVQGVDPFPFDAGLVDVEVHGTKLHVHPLVATFLKRRNVVSALAFVSFLRATPEAIGKEFGWSASVTAILLDRLLAALKGVLPDDVLLANWLPRRLAMGARDPALEPGHK